MIISFHYIGTSISYIITYKLRTHAHVQGMNYAFNYILYNSVIIMTALYIYMYNIIIIIFNDY